MHFQDASVMRGGGQKRNAAGIVGAGKWTPRVLARPSLSVGLKAPKAYRLGAFRHGF